MLVGIVSAFGWYEEPWHSVQVRLSHEGENELEADSIDSSVVSCIKRVNMFCMISKILWKNKLNLFLNK